MRFFFLTEILSDFYVQYLQLSKFILNEIIFDLVESQSNSDCCSPFCYLERVFVGSVGVGNASDQIQGPCLARTVAPSCTPQP